MGDVDVRVENAKAVIDSWDTVFTALSAEPRRQLVLSLSDAPPGETVALPESARNPNVPIVLAEFRLRLRHVHLPLLADCGFIDWQREPFVAARGPQFDEIAIVLESLQRTAGDVPDSLVIGCQRLERERQSNEQ